jgi:VWFA-related protein
LSALPDFGGPDFTFSKRVDEVQLIFTVTDKKGRFIDKLGAEDFRLFDNELPPEQFYKFERRTNLPLEVVLLVDVSSSVQGRFKFEQKAAATFLKKILQPGRDKAAVIAFGSQIQQVQDMTHDTEKLEASIRQLQPYGDTALYDAITRGANTFAREGETQGTRKLIIVLSDGKDTTSKASETDAIRAVARSEAMVVVVDSSFLDLEAKDDENSFMRRVTKFSGGTVLRAETNNELSAAFRSIERGLRTQYALNYKPAAMETAETFRSIRLVPHKSKWIVHCRSGYYARKR